MKKPANSLAVRRLAAKVAVAVSEKTGRPVDPRVKKLAESEETLLRTARSMPTTIERIAHKAQVRDAQKRLARIEEMRDALSLEQEGMSQRDIAQALGTTQPRVRRLLQGARSFETTSITPEEVILRATVEETDRDALVKELSSFTYTSTRVAPYPHDGSVTGTWSQVSAAHQLGLLSHEEYESVRYVANSEKTGRPVDPRVAELAAGIDYRTARAQRQAALADEQAYEQAYRDAGRAMDLAELVYAIIADMMRRPPC